MPDTVPDWRRVFDAIRVPWIDHGRNVGMNEVNIKCPWCPPSNPDPSMHLSLSTRALVYYCKRNPEHKGGHRGGGIKLLRQLGVPRQEADLLLDNYASHVQVQTAPTGIEQDAVTKKWNRFTPAIQNRRILDYLYSQRGFPDPAVVCQRYDLRFQPIGEWAGRVLFPIVENGKVLSWTGRAIFEHLRPKYKMVDVRDQTGLVYVGRAPRQCCVVVEGPMDALKINAACEHLPVSAIALTGLALSDWSSANPDRLLRVKTFLKPAEIRLIALDSSVPIANVKRMMNLLAQWENSYIIRHVAIPAPFNDPGAMDYDSLRTWITTVSTTVMGKNHATPSACVASKEAAAPPSRNFQS